MKILEGIKVVDLSRYISGPNCCQLLGNLGADVIKVESPNGEPVREYEPAYNGDSFYYMVFNRNKRGITVNTRTDDGKEILRRLFKDADVIVENYKPGTLDKMGFSYDELKKINSKVILCSISGFGQTGPMSKLPGFDSILQAKSGLMSLTGDPDGEPYLMGTFAIDYVTSIYCAYGILAALIAREKTGEGQWVQTSLLDSAMSLLIDIVPEDLMLGKRRNRIGNLDKCTAPVGAFKDVNGEYVYIIAAPQNHWELLANIIGKPELINDERFLTVPIRHQHAKEVNAYFQQWVGQHTYEEVIDTLNKAGIPVTKVLTVHEFLQLEQVRHNNQIINVPYGNYTVPMQGFPVTFTSTPSEIYYGAPTLGQHNQEILKGIGFTDEQIAIMKENGSI